MRRRREKELVTTSQGHGLISSNETKSSEKSNKEIVSGRTSGKYCDKLERNEGRVRGVNPRTHSAAKESQEHASYERHLQEKIKLTSQNPHASLKKALEELRNLKAYNQRLKEAGETLRNGFRQ